ncbi:MAG: cation:dicarboxylase symporter family transporter [Gemmatimonadota bacterium]|nr:MAG: cation:dicarboxylase symporter family transporter [Gemmatimonadota bacterium]
MTFAKVPAYVWTFLALVLGIVFGGWLPEMLAPIARLTAALIRFIVALVPLLIFAALSPAIATLVRRGLAGRFAGSVVLWYVMTSAIAGAFGLVVSSLIFKIPFSAVATGAASEATTVFRAFGELSGASLPLVAILGSVLLGVVAVWIEPLYAALKRIETGIAGIGGTLGYVMLPLILMFGITIGVRFGARLGIGHYFTMTFYTATLCFVWWLFYVFVIIRYLARRPAQKVVTEYYLPTAIFAAGTCSSLATLPVNLACVRKYGVRDEVADFVVPFGAVFNLDASTLMYVAYAPFVLTHVFGITTSWTTLLVAWPAIVLFTIAAPGLPAGIGTALWSSTLFASMLGLGDPLKSDFITTWIALAGGLPDMFRTATNCTGDGFTAITFDSLFDKFFRPRTE